MTAYTAALNFPIVRTTNDKRTAIIFSRRTEKRTNKKRRGENSALCDPKKNHYFIAEYLPKNTRGSDCFKV
jgi:hypothetical protein